MSPIKRRKRQTFAYRIFVCKIYYHLCTMSEDVYDNYVKFQNFVSCLFVALFCCAGVRVLTRCRQCGRQR